MRALVSSSARIAGLVEGDRAWLIRADQPMDEKPIDVEALKGLFDRRRDTLRFENVSRADALQVLKRESSKDGALLLTLMVLDSALPSATRLNAAASVESLLLDEQTFSHLRKVLYTRPLDQLQALPDSERLGKASPKLSEFLSSLCSRQSDVFAIHEATEQYMDAGGLDQDQRAVVLGTLTALGVFESLCDPDASRARSATLQFDALTKLSSVPSSRQLVSNLFRRFGSRPDDDREKESPGLTLRSSDFSSESESAPKYVFDSEAYRSASAQIEKICELLDEDKEPIAVKFAEELVAQQLARDDAPYAAMSLCKISEKAKAIGNFSLQLTWAEKAASIASEDPRTHAHVGEALLNLNRLGEAESAFRRTQAAGERLFGASGLARVYRLAYRLEDALKVIDDTIDDNYRDENILMLKASILRDLGRYRQASELFSELMETYPDSPSPLCGYAATLADMRRFQESEAFYRLAVERFPTDHISWSGLGFLLVRQGEFTKGLKYLDKAISLDLAHDGIALFSKLTALRWKGRFQACEKICREMISKQPREIGWWRHLILGQIDQGDYESAENSIRKARLTFDSDSPPLNRLQATVLRRKGELAGALGMLDALKQKYPMWFDSLVDRANVLKHMGEYDQAKHQLDFVLQRYPNHRYAINSFETLRALAGEASHTTPDVGARDLVTPGDWRTLLVRGLVVLGNGDAKAAKPLLLRGSKKCPFQDVRCEFDLPLAAARTLLGQTSTALNTVKNPRNDIAVLQQAIVYGEMGNARKAKRAFSRVHDSRPDTANVIELFRKRYVQRSGNARPTIEQIMHEQVDVLLRAA